MVVDSTEKSMRLFYSNGNGTFGSAIVHRLGDTPTSIVTGDFNADGAQDAAVTLISSTAIPIFFNQGGVRMEETAGENNQGLVIISAKVTPSIPGNPAPTGTVTFREGTKILATVTLSGGSGGFTTTSLSSGNHAIIATYNGSSTYNTGTVGPLTFPVR